MDIIVEQGKLAKALGVVSRVAAGSRTTLPILNNVLIKAVDNKVMLITTNLDMAIVNYLGVADSKNGEITVPARLLADFVSNLPRGEVKLSGDDSKLTVSSGKYKSIFNGAPAEDFPELPDINESESVIYRMSVETFKTGINEVKIAASSDTTRPALTGVYFNTYEGDLYIAATDGYRLAERIFIEKVESDVKAIVPSGCLIDVLGAISDNMNEIEIVFDNSQVRFRLGEIEITSKLIDGSFPDYRRLIPEKVGVDIKMSKVELLRIVKLAALFSRGVGGSIICEAKSSSQTFSVSSVANEFGENASDLEAEILADGKVILNSRYLIDAINVIEEENLTFGISGKLAPVVIRNEKSNNYTHIIMPLKS